MIWRHLCEAVEELLFAQVSDTDKTEKYVNERVQLWVQLY